MLNPVSSHFCYYSHYAVLNPAWLFGAASSQFSAFTASSSMCDVFPRTAPRFVKYNMMRMMEKHDTFLGIKFEETDQRMQGLLSLWGLGLLKRYSCWFSGLDQLHTATGCGWLQGHQN